MLLNSFKNKASLYLIIFLLFCHIANATEGKLTVKTTTSTANGQYSPRNIAVIWVEDTEGNFIKTLLLYSKFYTTYLNTWEASTKKAGSTFNSVDAITGASRINHGKLECYWNGKNFKGEEVPDGDYKVWFEMTEKNATGNFTSFQFSKGAKVNSATVKDVQSFSSNSIIWEPGATNVVENKKLNISVYPNPAYSHIKIKAESYDFIEIRDVVGNLMYRGTSSTIDISNFAKGTYFVNIFSDGNSVVKKISKK